MGALRSRNSPTRRSESIQLNKNPSSRLSKTMKKSKYWKSSDEGVRSQPDPHKSLNVSAPHMPSPTLFFRISIWAYLFSETFMRDA
ncbi:hypothetical protein Sjap_016038 [Stephania japonica]|uniref:Uncharacterized protein n=1 Tax=Stephania japonica TaxID=461633 RepID=A0AAP0ILW2_9MAGN